MIAELREILAHESTRALRLALGAGAVLFGMFLMLGAVNHFEYAVTFSVMPAWAWGGLFVVHGVALVTGALSKQYSLGHLFFEGFLGSLLWLFVAITSMMSQGSPGAITICPIVCGWLVVRYPSWKNK